MNIKNTIKTSLIDKIVNRSKGNRKPASYDESLGEFDYLQGDASRMINRFYILTSNSTKETVGEYQKPESDTLQQHGPTVYGYTITVGPDGRPRVMEFGNVVSFAVTETEKEDARSAMFGEIWNEPNSAQSKISHEREEPVVDINSTGNGVKVVLEILGVKEEDIAINAYDGKLEVLTNSPQRYYHKLIELPYETDTETARFTYNNGILEVTFKKKKNMQPKRKEIRVG